MKWMLLNPSIVFGSVSSSVGATQVRSSERRPPPVIVTSVAFAFVVVLCCILCASPVVESSSATSDVVGVGVQHNKGPNMQNVVVGDWSKVVADDGASPSSMRRSNQQQQQQQKLRQHQYSMYKGFEHKLGQLSEYGRDRFDSSRQRGVSRLDNVADDGLNNDAITNEMHDVKIVGARITRRKRVENKNVAENAKHIGRKNRRKRQTILSKSFLINDKRLLQLRPNNHGGGGGAAAAENDDRFPNARVRMRKVLSVLIPNQQQQQQRRQLQPTRTDADVDDNDDDDGIHWHSQIENAENNAVSGEQELEVKNNWPDVHGVRRISPNDETRYKENAKRIADHHHLDHHAKHSKYLNTQDEVHTKQKEAAEEDDEHFSVLPLTNACELCASATINQPSPLAPSIRCCLQDAKQPKLNKIIANNRPAQPQNKSKRQTEQKVAHNFKAINSYQTTLNGNQKLMQLPAAVYPEIVAKTSSMLATDNYRQPQMPASAAAAARFPGNSYADFLNYYDQHQQVVRQQQQQQQPAFHNLLSSSALLRSSSGLATVAASADSPSPAQPTSGVGGESLYPVVPNINLSAHALPAAASQPLATLTTLSPAPPDYYNNNSSHLSTPLTTNAPSSVYNAVTRAEGPPGGQGGGGSALDVVGEEAQTCAKYIDASNTSLVLQRVLDELERIRMLAPEGQ